MNGARRIAACVTQLLEPLELRQHLLSGGASGGQHLDEHLEAARPICDLAAASMQLLLALPAASASRPGAGLELMRLLSALLGSFALGSNLPTAERAASQALPRAASAMLHMVVTRSLLPRLLRLLRRELGQPALHANALLACAVAISSALGSSVPLSTLFDPSGALGSNPAASRATAMDSLPMSGSGGIGAWQALSASLTQPAFKVRPVELLLSILSALLHDSAHAGATSVANTPAGSVQATGQQQVGTATQTGAPPARSVPSSAGAICIRVAGGFVLNAEHTYAAEQRVEMLFSLPGCTMLDTLVGLLLASCLKGVGGDDSNAAAEASASTASPLLDALLAASMPLGSAGDGSSYGLVGTGSSGCVQLSLLDFLNAAVDGDGFAPALAPQLRIHLATRHLRAHTLLLQFGPSSVPERFCSDLRLRLRRSALCAVRTAFSRFAAAQPHPLASPQRTYRLIRSQVIAGQRQRHDYA